MCQIWNTHTHPHCVAAFQRNNFLTTVKLGRSGLGDDLSPVPK
jgi:hypothetical protein